MGLLSFARPSPVIPAVPTKRPFRRKRASIAILLAVAFLAPPVPLEAQSAPQCPGPVYPMQDGDEAITVSSTAIGFTSTKINNARQGDAVQADCSIATDNIRYRINATPTATVGVLILSTAGQFSVCGAQNVKQIRFIRQTNDAALYCIYYGNIP